MGNLIREMYGKLHKRDVSMGNFIREMYGKFHSDCSLRLKDD